MDDISDAPWGLIIVLALAITIGVWLAVQALQSPVPVKIGGIPIEVPCGFLIVVAIAYGITKALTGRKGGRGH